MACTSPQPYLEISRQQWESRLKRSRRNTHIPRLESARSSKERVKKMAVVRNVAERTEQTRGRERYGPNELAESFYGRETDGQTEDRGGAGGTRGIVLSTCRHYSFKGFASHLHRPHSFARSAARRREEKRGGDRRSMTKTIPGSTLSTEWISARVETTTWSGQSICRVCRKDPAYVVRADLRPLVTARERINIFLVLPLRSEVMRHNTRGSSRACDFSRLCRAHALAIVIS